MSSAPVEWDYNGLLIKLHFHAGLMGTTQNNETLALSSRIVWVVTHDPPQDGPERIKELEKEIEAIQASNSTGWTTDCWLKRAQKELVTLRQQT